MKLDCMGIQNQAPWEQAGIRLPKFDWNQMRAQTQAAPVWVHFGAGNIFRGFIAKLQQDLLEQGLVSTGIVAADTFDLDIIDKIYDPHHSMTLLATLLPDGSVKKRGGGLHLPGAAGQRRISTGYGKTAGHFPRPLPANGQLYHH